MRDRKEGWRDSIVSEAGYGICLSMECEDERWESEIDGKWNMD